MAASFIKVTEFVYLDISDISTKHMLQLQEIQLLKIS